MSFKSKQSSPSVKVKSKVTIAKELTQSLYEKLTIVSAQGLSKAREEGVKMSTAEAQEAWKEVCNRNVERAADGAKAFLDKWEVIKGRFAPKDDE